MDTVLPQKELEEMLDETVREVMAQETGIQLYLQNTDPGENVYTVYIDFENGLHSGLSMCADEGIMTRLTQNMMQEENVTWQDVEDFAKEFFNVLCGQISARLYKITGIASRFGMPVWVTGHYRPTAHREHFSLRYTSDKNEWMKLSHHTPVPQAGK